jgi:hypothetical protein
MNYERFRVLGPHQRPLEEYDIDFLECLLFGV